MKVVAFNGSPRQNSNTETLIKHVFAVLEEEGFKCEIVNLAENVKRGCTACLWCRENKKTRCYYDDDIINSSIQKMIEADGIIIGSPTYFSDVTAETKALIDRAGYVIKGNGDPLKRKVGAAIAVARRAGTMNVIQSINNFFFINGMVVPGSTYWNLGLGISPGDVESDLEGVATMTELGKNMAWLMKKLK